MDETFWPEDQAAYEAARDRFVAEFARSGGAGFERVAEQVLDLKRAYLDGDLGNWSVADVEEILFGLYPAKVLVEADEIGAIPAGFAALLRFLAGQRPEHEPPLEVLAEHVECSAPRFVAAMSDEDNWSFGKRMWSTAVAEGVDLSDEDELGRWVEGFNQRSVGERDQILGPLPGAGDGLLRSVLGPLPPVVLADEAKLSSSASEALLVRRLVALTEFVGSGRAVTDRGNLKLADAKVLVSLLGTEDRVDEQIGEKVFKTKSSEDLPEVDLIYRVALAAELLELDGRMLRPGPNAGWTDSPLDLLYGAFLVNLQRVGPTQHRYRKDHYGFGWYAEELDGQLSPLLLELYRHRDPREIGELAATMWDVLEGEYDLSDVPADKLNLHRDLVEGALRGAFDRLCELGVVEITDEQRTPNVYGGVERQGGTIALAPLGLWAMQRVASQLTDAPVAGALRQLSAEQLLRAAADVPDEMARAELDAWIDHHGDQSAHLLCDALATADETGRGLAFRALVRIGTPAADAVASLRTNADLADFVTVFRVDTLDAAPDEMDRADDPYGWTRLLHTVIELWGPDAAASAWAVPAAGAPGIHVMLNAVWRIRDQRTEVVLAAVGGHHPDKHIAKAARKALFKHRSTN